MVASNMTPLERRSVQTSPKILPWSVLIVIVLFMLFLFLEPPLWAANLNCETQSTTLYIQGQGIFLATTYESYSQV